MSARSKSSIFFVTLTFGWLSSIVMSFVLRAFARAAFAFVEIIIVSVVVGVLALAALPGFLKMRQPKLGSRSDDRSIRGLIAN